MLTIDGIISTKGGVGKSSVTVSSAAMLADLGKPTLIIDLDPQGSSGSYYTIKDRAQYGVTKLLTSGNPEDCVSTTSIENLHVVLNDDPTNQLSDWLKANHSHFDYLGYALSLIEKAGFFEHIFIDTQGCISPIQECVIKSVRRLISPITPEYLSAQEFSKGTLAALERMQPPPGISNSQLKLPPLYVVFNQIDKTIASREIIKAFNEISFDRLKSPVFICSTNIPNKKACFNKSVINHIPVHRLEIKRIANVKTPCSLETQLNLIYELFPHLEGKHPSWGGETFQMPAPNEEEHRIAKATV